MTSGVRAVLGPGGLLARGLAGWEPRPGQLAMAERIARALDDDERLFAEAGTGTGKTLAYLVPAILSGRKVVISTGTRTLQDQIARVDLPLLAQALPGMPPFAVMKGLSNYVCLRRLDEHDRQGHLALDRPSPELVRLRSWLGRTTGGERGELDGVPEEWPTWREITATPETRLGSRCRFFESCFVTGMRRRAAEARIVVVNHHLFFADLALRRRWPEAEVLPPYDAVIFDEAHQIDEVATEFFGLAVSTQRLFGLARDIGAAPAPEPARAQALGSRVQAASASFAEAVRGALPRPRPGAEEVRLPLGGEPLSKETMARYHDLDASLEEAATWFERIARPSRADDAVADEGIAAVLGGLGRRAAAVREDLGTLINAPPKHLVRWVQAGPRQVSLRAAPVDVAPVLARAFAETPGSLVFTSATLTVDNSFGYVRRALGLDDAASEAKFPSPFRYRAQALLYLAADLPEPAHADFAAAAAERLASLCALSGGRALLLFTSFRNLRVVEGHLRALGRHRLLVQGERPRHALLADFKNDVASVLLGSQSFWEGVDIPGDALSLVAIDKLPFDVPDDPLTAARRDRIADAGGDPFGEYQLPRAALALKQGFGRLIRRQADRGVVALLDGRLLRRSYGATLLGSLPAECPRTESLDDVAAFFTHRA